MSLVRYFKPWELRHLGDRAKQFGYEDVFQILLKLGWESEKRSLSEFEISSLNLALEKIGGIRGLKHTCIRENCEICDRIENLNSDRVTLPNAVNIPWILELSLYSWQHECLKSWWDNGGKGIIKVVTGAGKTILALALISQLKNKRSYRNNCLKIIVVVPTASLLDQWYEELVEKLYLNNEIGVYHADQKDDFNLKSIMLYVANSAREKLPEHTSEIKNKKYDIFLILDECHRYGSEKNSNIFNSQYDFALGLSATPERKQDYGFERILEKKIGKVVFNYTYRDALRDNIIPPFKLVRLYVPLTDGEKEYYEEISSKIKKFFIYIKNKIPKLKSNDPDFFKKLSDIKKKSKDKNLTNAIDNFLTLSIKRKEIIHNSEKKILAVNWLFKNLLKHNERTLIFHERTEVADKIYKLLKDFGYDVGIYHSNLNTNFRRKELRDYKNNKYQILITCRALDEGLDVPSTSNGVIVASTSSVRQRIQRIGRILRKSPGKDTSIIYSILIKELEEDILDYEEIKEIERVAEKIENYYIKDFD